MQPEVDVRKGNGLVKLFFDFRDDSQGCLCCDLVVVLEASEIVYLDVFCQHSFSLGGLL